MPFNLFSPYGRVVKYEQARKKGIFIRPASDSAPDGWTPERDEISGAPILPGTPDGGKPFRFLSRESGESGDWHCMHYPGSFFYGEIDWRGGLKSISKPLEGRWRLSYHGPNSRHFASDAFSYGSSEDHNNIYMEGRCVAVAPYPVLGAAIVFGQEMDEENQAQETMRLVAICKSGASDEVYCKPFSGGGVTREAYTEEYRNESMKLYDPDVRPEGWRNIGSYALDLSLLQGEECKVFEARTPWFFSEDGTKAVSTRECDVTFQIEGSPVTQKGYNIYRIDILGFPPTATNVTDLANTEGFSFDVTTTVTHQPNHTRIMRYPDYRYPEAEHSWSVHTIQQDMKMIGTYRVAADYNGNELRYLQVLIQHFRRHGQHVYLGVDDAPHPDWDDGQTGFDVVYSNKDTTVGDPEYYEDTGKFTPPVEPGGLTQPFTHANDQLRVTPTGSDNLHWLYRRLSGTRTEFETGVKDEYDHILFFVFHLSLFPHFWDFRDKEYTAVFAEERVLQGNWGASSIYDFRYESEDYYNGEGVEYDKFMVRNLPVTTTSGNRPLPWPLTQWFDDITKPTGGVGSSVTDLRQCKVIDGLWPKEILENWPPDVPSVLEFYAEEYFDLDHGMYPINEHLQSISKAYREGGFGVDDFGNTAFSVKYLDHNEEVAYYSELKDGSLSTLSKAEGNAQRFYPIGVS